MKTSQGLVAVFVLCFTAKCLDAQGPALVAEEEIAESINKGAFAAVVKDVANTVSPFLNVITSVVKFIFGVRSTPTDSPEMKYLRNLSESINRKFDEVNSKFTDVKNLIDWTAVQVSYGTYERNIQTVSDQFNNIFLVPTSGLNQQMQMFIIEYENGYDGSGYKLFKAFMEDQGVISQGLLRPAMKYTRNDRGKMRTFMLGILKLLLTSAKLELAFLGVKQFDSLVPFHIHQWQVRIEQVQEKMKAIDLELKNVYLRQSLHDIDRFASNSTNLQLSNKIFGQELYKELSTKYFWRDWFVVASTHTEGRSDAHSRVCDGVVKSVYRTKDLIIDSVERDKPTFYMREIQSLCASLNETCQNTATYIPCQTQTHCSYPYGSCTQSSGSSCYNYLTGSGPCRRFRRCGSYQNSENANDIFNWFGSVKTSCSTLSSVGIIATNKNPVYYAGPNAGSSHRLFVYDLGLCDYNVHFFG